MDSRDFFRKLGIFIGGVAVGGILGILFAPTSGKETREKIKETVNELETKTREKVEKIKELAQDAIEKGKKSFRQKVKES